MTKWYSKYKDRGFEMIGGGEAGVLEVGVGRRSMDDSKSWTILFDGERLHSTIFCVLLTRYADFDQAAVSTSTCFSLPLNIRIATEGDKDTFKPYVLIERVAEE